MNIFTVTGVLVDVDDYREKLLFAGCDLDQAEEAIRNFLAADKRSCYRVFELHVQEWECGKCAYETSVLCADKKPEQAKEIIKQIKWDLQL